MADVKGLLADPEFTALPLSQQRQVLGRVDPDFQNLSDADFDAFRARIGASNAVPGVPNPLTANPDKYTPAGLQKAPWGTFSSGPHKSFVETVGPDSTVGRIATAFGDISQYLPEEGATLAVPAEGAIGSFAQRARNLGTTVGSGAAVDWAANKLGLPSWVGHSLGLGTSVAVGSRLSPEIAAAMQKHGRGWLREFLGGAAEAKPSGPVMPPFNPSSNTATAGKTATVPTPPPSATPRGYFSSGGTVKVPESSTAAPATPLGPPSSLLDDLAKAQAGKPFGKLDARSQAVVRDLATKIHEQGVAPPPSGTAVPEHIPEHYREHYTQQAEIGHSEAYAKDQAISQHLMAKGTTPADVLDPAKISDAQLAQIQKDLGYRAQSGSRSRSMADFRKHLAETMRTTLPPPPK